MQSIIKRGNIKKYIMFVDILEDQSLMFTLAMDGILTDECFIMDYTNFTKASLVINIGKTLAYTRLCGMEDPITISDFI